MNILDGISPVDAIHSESSCADRMLCGKWPVIATWHGLGYCALRTVLNKVYLAGDRSRALTELKVRCENMVDDMDRLQRYDHSIAISDQAYEDLGEVYRIPPDQRSLVFNGFDTSKFLSSDSLRLATRARYGISPSSLVVGIIGRLTEDKGHRHFASLIPDILSRFANVRFLIAGEGPALRAYGDLMFVPTTYVGGVSYDDMPGIYNACDLVVDPTIRYEGLDMTIQEALLCGTPVLATDVGSIRKSLLPDWRYGTTFLLGDRSDLFQKFSTLIDKYDLRELGEAAVAYARRRFSLEEMCAGTEDAMKRGIALARERRVSRTELH